ncbi:hypothetical protein [uncultured Megasphaera sp.]|uniref:hypothetical protein n=1 Tax=uncultured Megasphaera sp. TaxID=165188 RepID=UPI0025CB85A7|nr:hypothetical protein [uncultured Megasphaera sp.]
MDTAIDHPHVSARGTAVEPVNFESLRLSFAEKSISLAKTKEAPVNTDASFFYACFPLI